MPVERQVSLFRNGRSQAVCIPHEFELPGTTAVMRKEGDRLIIEPTVATGLLGVLSGLPPLAGEDRLDAIADMRLSGRTSNAAGR